MLNPTFARYKHAADQLAEKNGHVIAVFNTEGFPNTFGFKVYKSDGVTLHSMWTVTVRRNSLGIAVIESLDYLNKPSLHIPGAKTYEFLALIDILEETEDDEEQI